MVILVIEPSNDLVEKVVQNWLKPSSTQFIKIKNFWVIGSHVIDALSCTQYFVFKKTLRYLLFNYIYIIKKKSRIELTIKKPMAILE